MCPDAIVKIVSCKCKSKTPCVSRHCSCKRAGLLCTDVCDCVNDCDNREHDEEDELVHADVVGENNGEVEVNDGEVEVDDIDFYNI